MNEFEFYKTMAHLIKTLPKDRQERHRIETQKTVEEAHRLQLITDEELRNLYKLLSDEK